MNPSHRKTVGLIWVMLLCTLWGTDGVSQNNPPHPNVYVIPISGDVEPAMAAFLKRSLEEIPDREDSLIVIEMDTFGGRVDSALEMVDLLVNLKKARTIALVTRKAISAGALISLACNQLIMYGNTTIGDCAPITYSNEGPKMMGEKFQSPLRAKFRTLARRNGYPIVLAEAMVTVEMEVYGFQLDGKYVYMDAHEYQDLDPEKRDRIANKKTIVAKGELLTMDDSEAQELGFSSMSVKSLDEMLDRLELGNASVTKIERSWSEDLVSLITKLSPILMLIGLGALYTEIKAPGFGAPGIIGIICLSLVLFNQYMVGLADYTELLLIVLGIIFMAAELFVLPGFGVAGIAGIICIAAGLLLSFQDFVIPDPKLPWEQEILIHNLLRVFGSLLGSFFMALLILRYIFPALSKKSNGPYLQTTLSEARLDFSAQSPLQTGQTGTALTPLRPSGKARIDGEPYDVVTQGDFIPRGAKIKVIRLKGNKITVTQVDSNG